MLSVFRENEKSGAVAAAEDDEIFFGPVGHTEKCVAVAVNEVVQAGDRLRPLSPLTATQMAELCREAYTVAYRLEHADTFLSSDAYRSKLHTTGSSDRDKMSNFKHGDSKMPSFSHAEITPTSSENEMSNVEHADSMKPPSSCAETTAASSNDEMSNIKVSDTIKIRKCCGVLDVELAESSESPSLHAAATGASNNDEVSNIKDTDSAEPQFSHADITAASSSDPNVSPVEDLVENVPETDGRSCVDEALPTSTYNDITLGATESRELCDDNTSPSNSFEGLLSSLGSALPVIEPGSLKQDEHGVVKFAAAAHSDSSADANAKSLTAIPSPNGLRRAFSAKTSAVRSAGIPMKVLTVRHNL